ncbi:hypothetical protein NFI96_009813, partial [Prochilodus magdalenae]
KLILIQQSLTWREALWYCREKHLDLVSVHSEEIQLWVKEVAQKASTKHVWLGLRHTCAQSLWYWVSGFSICYQNWAPGYGTGGEDCVSVERTGAVQSGGKQQWVSLPEDQELNFICTTYEEMDQNWVSLSFFFLSAVCGVSAHVPYRYVVVSESKTWTEAQNYCRQNYTDLATINTMEEMKKLNATLNDKPSSSVWIGLVRRGIGEWLWSLADGGFYSEGGAYRNWNSGEPDNAKGQGNEFCVGMFKDSGTWFDVLCDGPYTFVCYDENKTNTERYVFINEKKSWYGAQSYCRDHHTDLVRVRNQTENQQVFNLNKQHPASHIWIGLFYDSWTWSDQSNSSFRYWKSGPDHYGQGAEGNCTTVSITEKGRWDNETCSNQLPFICYQNKLILIQQNLTWREALWYCREKHLDLVSVHSEEIQLWVKEVAQKASTKHNWAPGNGTGGEDCWSVERTGAVQSGGEQQWVSLPENQKLNFICTTYEAVCGVSALVPYRYVIVNKSRTWTEAQNHCRQTYTDLATINTLEEMKKLNASLKDKPSSSVWIGLSRGGTGKWLWSLADGGFYSEQDTYRNWGTGEPNDAVGRKEFCVGMFKDSGTWFDVLCDGPYTFVCYDGKKTNTERYVFNNEKKSWYEAQSYCRDRHTDLVRVRNQTENQQVFNLTKQSQSDSAIWIGLFNDSWTWSDQSDSSFRYWKSGPDHYGQGAECAAVSMTEKGRWDKETCSNQLPFICHQNKLILIQQNLTWSEALWYCRENHLDLVLVHSVEIQLWVMEVAQKASTEHVWLGLRHTCTLSFWYWVSGESICYQNWAPGNGTGEEHCRSVERTGAVQSGGKQQWVSLPENQKLNFICTTYEKMDQNWVSITFFFFSAVCGVSAHVPHQYVVVSESKTWTEAQNYCRQNYTDLATINTMEEMKKLNATLKDKPSSSVWIGLSRGGTGKWLWSLVDGGYDSEGGAYRNWASGEPNNAGGKEFCVAMKNDAEIWFDVRCDASYTFVCYDEKKTNTERYVFINEKKSWYEAQSYCRDHHTDLVRVRNQTENQQIFNLTKQHPASHIWIGLFYDSWTWSDQSNSSFRYWKSGSDHYGQGAEGNCTTVSITEKGRWDNETCSNQLPFICYQNKLILIQQSLTWREALWYCREKHLDLVSVHSEEIQLWVMEVAQKASTKHVWLGLRHTCAQSLWYWVSGFSICYQNWAPGNGTGGEDCWSVERTGAVQSGGEQQWVSLPENQKLNFICTTYEGCEISEMDLKWISVILLFSAMCGVSAYVPHRYIFVNESKTWFEAQSYCRETYTDLVTLNTTEEMKNLNALLKDKVTSLFWIGLIRGSTGKWLWSLANGSSYSELDAYLNWRSGEPNNLGQNEYCVGMFIKDGTWFDVSCFYPHCFVCYDENKANTERYIFIYKWKNMSNAQSYCREHHTDLASVRNQAESCFNVDRFWISLVNDSWTWSDQSTSSFRDRRRRLLGTPAYLVCHQGVEFTSHLLHVTCKQWGVVQKLTTDNYPQTNFTERIKQTCKAWTASYLYDKPFVTPVRSLASRVPAQ